jgi:hypothetical protein
VGGDGWYLEHGNGLRVGPFDSYQEAVFAREGLFTADPPDIVLLKHPWWDQYLALFCWSLVIAFALILIMEVTK